MKYFMICVECGECGEPLVVDVCKRLGYNPGVDGHMKATLEEAQKELQLVQPYFPDLPLHIYEVEFKKAVP